MKLLKEIRTSYSQNKNLKGRIVVCSYYLMRYFRLKMTNKILKLLFSPIIIFYKFITDFCLKCEIPASTQIGEGLIIHHATGLVINGDVIIGKNVTLNHNITIGNKSNENGDILGCPVLGDNVIIHPHSIIIGPIKIGKNSVVGAGSVVIKDVPANSIVAGNPARIIRVKEGY